MNRAVLKILALGIAFALAGGEPSARAQTLKGRPSATGFCSTFMSPLVWEHEAHPIDVLEHDPEAFTQGLCLQGDLLYESTGLYGKSSIRILDAHTGRVIKKEALDKKYFGEGITLFQDKLYQLTWKEETGFIYDPTTLEETGRFHYSGEGWGLTHDESSLIMSNGTPEIRFVDAENFETIRTIEVHRPNREPVTRINELQYVNGEILANIWKSTEVLRINPADGEVLGVINAAELAKPYLKDAHSVLNGMAFDPTGQRLWMTGKNWPVLFEVELKPL
jgi:glutamine cyclotransferase